MSWEAAPNADDWGTGEATATSGGDEWGTPTVAATSGGDEWGIPAVASSEQPGVAFNDGGAADNVYGGEYGGGEQPGGGGGFSGGCFNCGEEGHAKAECPNPPKARPCFNCGEEGHTKADCTNPAVAREFTGTCRICEQEGHRAADCPTAPPKLCNNCKQEGHSIIDCKNPRKIEHNDVEDVQAEVAWANLIKQSEEGDFDDMKDEAMKYIKASPDATYPQLEKAFRSQNIPIYLIAMEKELSQTFTNMDLQGNLDRKYTVSWRKSSKHNRPKEKENWPATPEENLERLADAGQPVDRGIPLCSRCNELGHISKHCSEEPSERERVQVQCYNCNEIGHRVRDCPIPREDRFACRNCKKSGHTSKECPEPRSAEGVECKNCNEKTATNLATEPRIVPMNVSSFVATAMQRVIPVRNAQSLVIILAFNARTASRWATPRFDARSLPLKKMVLAMLLVTLVATAVAKSQPTLVLMEATMRLPMNMLLQPLVAMITGAPAMTKRLQMVLAGRWRVSRVLSRIPFACHNP